MSILETENWGGFHMISFEETVESKAHKYRIKVYVSHKACGGKT